MKIGQGSNMPLFKSLQNMNLAKNNQSTGNDNMAVNKSNSKSIKASSLNLGLSNMDIFKMHMKSNKTKEENSIINNARKDNPALDKMLYAADMAKLHEEQSRAENIAKKIAKGEKLTKEEKEFIEKYDPELVKKAEKAKGEGDRVRQALKNAKSDIERSQIAMQAISQATDVQKKSEDKVYGNLLVEAISKAVTDYNKKHEKIGKLDTSTNPMDELKGIIESMEAGIEDPKEAESFKKAMNELLGEMDFGNANDFSEGELSQYKGLDIEI